VVSLPDAALSVASGALWSGSCEYQAELGPDLHGVSLYGSRARGEPAHDESDVDILVVARRRDSDDDLRPLELRDEAADAESVSSSRNKRGLSGTWARPRKSIRSNSWRRFQYGSPIRQRPR
jgi:predicted nucleotidyltransferase